MSTSSIDEILKRLRELQNELEDEIDQILTEKRKQFRYTFERGKVRFEQNMKALQRDHKIGIWHYIKAARLGHILSAPFVYLVLIPFLLLDVIASLYQHVCFRVYGIPTVRRLNYLVIDRQQLVYLNIIEKINCTYCAYGNGVIEYVREIAARTEQYWCPIKHARRTADPHRLVDNFVDFGDAEAYKIRLKQLQHEITTLKTTEIKGASKDIK